ncbi:MAG: hypothetical protein ACOCXR_03325 [Phototrophicaceae bacterium]
MTTYEEVLSVIEKLPTVEKARLLEDISAALRRELAQRESGHGRSLFGAFADLGTAPSAEDIDNVRREMRNNFPREDI